MVQIILLCTVLAGMQTDCSKRIASYLCQVMSSHEQSCRVLLGDELLGDELLGDELLGDELLGDELLGDDLLSDELLSDELRGDELRGDELPVRMKPLKEASAFA